MTPNIPEASRPSRKLGLLLAFTAITTLAVWTLVLRMVWRPVAPPEQSITVTGLDEQRVVADRVSFKMTACAHSDHELKAMLKVIQASATAKLGASALVLGTAEADDEQNGSEHCREFDVRSNQPAVALAWRNSLANETSRVRIERDDNEECTRDAGFAAIRRTAEATAIADARSKVDALAGHTIHALLNAQVTSTEGTWDEQCARLVSATANLSVKP